MMMLCANTFAGTFFIPSTIPHTDFDITFSCTFLLPLSSLVPQGTSNSHCFVRLVTFNRACFARRFCRFSIIFHCSAHINTITISLRYTLRFRQANSRGFSACCPSRDRSPFIIYLLLQLHSRLRLIHYASK